MTVTELILYLAPCIIQIFISVIEIRHNKEAKERRLRFVSLLAFIALTFGMLMIIGVYGRFPYMSRLHLFYLARIGLDFGSLFWLISQLIWLKHRITIKDE